MDSTSLQLLGFHLMLSTVLSKLTVTGKPWHYFTCFAITSCIEGLYVISQTAIFVELSINMVCFLRNHIPMDIFKANYEKIVIKHFFSFGRMPTELELSKKEKWRKHNKKWRKFTHISKWAVHHSPLHSKKTHFWTLKRLFWPTIQLFLCYEIS